MEALEDGFYIFTLASDDGSKLYVDGRQVIDSGEPTLVDGAEIRRQAQRAADALWMRARAGG